MDCLNTTGVPNHARTPARHSQALSPPSHPSTLNTQPEPSKADLALSLWPTAILVNNPMRQSRNGIKIIRWSGGNRCLLHSIIR